MKFSDREIAQILAALRLWQRIDAPDSWVHFADPGITAMNNDEIDELCERINFEGGER